VKVRAPASTANLGPGFDCLGAAVTLSLEIDTDAGGALAKMIRRAVRTTGGEDAPSNGVVSSEIPTARGLGSSAACVAAGLLIGCAASGREVDRAELLRLGTEIEGHPDNLAAALYGGITLVRPDGVVMRYEPAGGVRPLILVPSESLPTKQARKVLPESVPRADAVANAARVAGLLTMLTGAATATADALLDCTDDRIHQPYRAPLMPRTAETIADLRGRGIAAALSGAGPSVVCLVLRGQEDVVRSAAGSLDRWKLVEVDWDLEGARVVGG
jgi:homoserine kinase